MPSARDRFAQVETTTPSTPPFFGEAVDYTSGPTLAFVLEGCDRTTRKTIGATNPADADPDLCAASSRAMPTGFVHGSDSTGSASVRSRSGFPMGWSETPRAPRLLDLTNAEYTDPRPQA